jgi:hypothetical protein
MIQFPIIVIKSLFFYRVCLLVRKVYAIFGIIFGIILLLLSFVEEKEIVQVMPFFKIFFSAIGFIFIIAAMLWMLLYSLEENYKVIGYFTLSEEHFIIQLIDEEYYNLNETNTSNIKIVYQETRYSSPTMSLETLRIQMGYTNTINFTQEGKNYSFRFLSVDEQDKNKIKEIVTQSELLKKRVGVS